MKVCCVLLALAVPTMLLPLDAMASYQSGKVCLYGVYMEPRGMAAEDFSSDSWGAGLRFVLPIPGMTSFIAPVAGFEIVNMLSKTTEFRDQLTGLRIEQRTNQTYARISIGVEAGPHVPFPVRPFLGMNLALVTYGIDTDVVVPDDSNRENDIRQNLRSKQHWGLGYDLTVGGDINFLTHFSVGGGYRYIKSYSVPQSLGDGSVEVSPEYGQVFIEVGIMFSAFSD
jgi:opacity protein-like surface antigen